MSYFFFQRLLDIEKRLIERLETLSGKIENEIAQKIIRNSEQPYVGWPALSNVSMISFCIASSYTNLAT